MKTIPAEQELFMSQYLSVKVFCGVKFIPILPKAIQDECETFESKMNTETFEEFKERTYGRKEGVKN